MSAARAKNWCITHIQEGAADWDFESEESYASAQDAILAARKLIADETNWDFEPFSEWGTNTDIQFTIHVAAGNSGLNYAQAECTMKWRADKARWEMAE